MNQSDGTPPTGGLPSITEVLWALFDKRGTILVTAILCGGAAMPLVLLRQPVYIADAQLYVGSVPPLGFLEEPGNLARRLASKSQFLTLAQYPDDKACSKNTTGTPVGAPSTTTPANTTTTPNESPMPPAEFCALTALARAEFLDTLHVSSSVEANRTVTLKIEGGSKTLVTQLADRAIATILADHSERFAELQSLSLNQAKAYQHLLDALLAERARRASQPPATPADRADETLVQPNTATDLITIADRVADLENRRVVAAARKTLLVSGPDVTRSAPRPRAHLAGPAAFLAGALLSGVLVAARTALKGIAVLRPVVRE
ncbi:MAG: hypothetical protein IPK13_17145 [Deltaproteobacteria bacterium]|nr:hypothetical protein [Deltaproteobacteria bacterium]